MTLTALYLWQSNAFGKPWYAELWIGNTRLYQSIRQPTASYAVANVEAFATRNGYYIAARINGRFRGQRRSIARQRHLVP